jgi:hypothetical protein
VLAARTPETGGLFRNSPTDIERTNKLFLIQGVKVSSGM